MIELNLLEKKQPIVLPTVLGIDLNTLNLKMLGVSLIIYYVPGMLVSTVYTDKTTNAESALQALVEQNNQVRSSIDKDANIKSQVDAYKAQVIKLQTRSAQVDEILKSRTNPKKILENIARSIPEDVWFTQMAISSKSEISIMGGSYTPRAVGEFITNINDSPYYGGSVAPVKQENKKEELDGVLTSYELFELKGKINNYDMRSK